MNTVAYSKAKTVLTDVGEVKIVGIKLATASDLHVGLDVTLHKVATGELKNWFLTAHRVVSHDANLVYGYHSLMEMYFYPIMFQIQLYNE